MSCMSAAGKEDANLTKAQSSVPTLLWGWSGDDTEGYRADGLCGGLSESRLKGATPDLTKEKNPIYRETLAAFVFAIV